MFDYQLMVAVNLCCCLQSHQIDCCTAVKVIENARSSWPAQDAAVLQHLIEMLAVLEWNSPSYCCTQVSGDAQLIVVYWFALTIHVLKSVHYLEFRGQIYKDS